MTKCPPSQPRLSASFTQGCEDQTQEVNETPTVQTMTTTKVDKGGKELRWL